MFCTGHLIHRKEGLAYNFWTIALPFADEDGRISFIIGCGQIDVLQTWPWQETVKMLGIALIHPPEYIDIGHGLPAENYSFFAFFTQFSGNQIFLGLDNPPMWMNEIFRGD